MEFVLPFVMNQHSSKLGILDAQHFLSVLYQLFQTSFILFVSFKACMFKALLAVPSSGKSPVMLTVGAIAVIAMKANIYQGFVIYQTIAHFMLM